MLMQNFGVTNKEHYGTLWYFLEWLIRIHSEKEMYIITDLTVACQYFYRKESLKRHAAHQQEKNQKQVQ